MKTNARQRTRQIAAPAPQTPAPKQEPNGFKFLNPVRPEPRGHELATLAFQDAFGEIAQARVDELRAEIFQTAEQIARAFVQSHERALENSLKID